MSDTAANETKENLKKRYDFIKQVKPEHITKLSEDEWTGIKDKFGFNLGRDQFLKTISIFQKLSLDQFIDVAQNNAAPAVKLSSAEMAIISGGWRWNLYALTCFGNYGHIDQDGIHISI